MATQNWTEEEIDTLRKMAAAGVAPPVIAHALKRTKNSVIGRAHRLGINFTFLRSQLCRNRRPEDVDDVTRIA